MPKKRRTSEIRDFILEKANDCARDIPRAVVEKFGVSRQAASKNVRALIQEGILIAEGSPRNRTYRLKLLVEIQISKTITNKLEENQVWQEDVVPHLKDIKENVREICHHGFTEMFNNVIDHSGSEKADIFIERNAVSVRIRIRDYGIGIWKKLQDRFHLADYRHAILELAKGKLTTDPERHTGEGIFFTSRMFDNFILESETLSYCCFHFHESAKDEEWLFDVKESKELHGTAVFMEIHLASQKTTKEVFDRFASDLDEFGFTKTQLSIELAKYEGDHLVSRSQAKRIVARLQEFKEVWLDFRGITAIGQAFADEIFRVFQKSHPEVHLEWTNTTPAVENMIKRAISSDNEQQEEQPELPLA